MIVDIHTSALCIAAYGIGSIPSGFLIGRLKGINDIRNHGSGSIGATNVARMFGTRYFFLVFFLDFFKAALFLALLVWAGYEDNTLIPASFFLLLGNGFPIFLGFKGGKGVATSFGVLAVVQPSLLICALSVWLMVFCVGKTVGMASVITFALMPLWVIWGGKEISLLRGFIFFIAGLVLFLHRDNIKNFYYSFKYKR